MGFLGFYVSSFVTIYSEACNHDLKAEFQEDGYECDDWEAGDYWTFIYRGTTENVQADEKLLQNGQGFQVRILNAASGTAGPYYYKIIY